MVLLGFFIIIGLMLVWATIITLDIRKERRYDV